MAAALVAGIGAGLAYVSCVLCCKSFEYCNHRKKAHQQEDIYNISGRVQNQDQWPTHNAHLSIDHISIMNQINKPIYDDAPPSYEEVMKTAMQTPPAGESSTPSQIVVESPKTTSAETRQL